MYKLAHFLVRFLAIFIVLVLSLSVLVINTNISHFVLKNIGEFYGYESEFNIVKTEWHPYKPTLHIENVESTERAKEGSKLIISELSLQIDLIKIFILRPLKSVQGLNGAVTIDVNSLENSELINSFQFNFASKFPAISFLRLENITLSLYGSEPEINIENFSVNLNQDKHTYVHLILKEISAEGALEFSLTPSFNQVLEDSSNAFLKISDLGLHRSSFKSFCELCSKVGKFNGLFFMSYLDGDLKHLTGNAKLNLSELSKDFTEVESKIHLMEEGRPAFSVASTFASNDGKVEAPNIFLSLSANNIKIIVPELHTSNDILRSFVSEWRPFSSLLEINGLLKNIIFNFNKSEPLRVTAKLSKFELIDNLHGSLKGFDGKILISGSRALVRVDSPSFNIVSDRYFDNQILLNSLKSDLFFTRDNGIYDISSTSINAFFGENKIEASLHFNPLSLSTLGDLSFAATVNGIDLDKAKKLIPNINSIQFTKSWISQYISCGLINKASLTLRTPIDYQFLESTSGFQMNLETSNACLNFSSLELKAMDFYAEVDNDKLNATLLGSDFYGSNVISRISIDKDNNAFILSLDGEADGPLSSLINIYSKSKNNLIVFDNEILGNHVSSFSFYSPLENTFQLLGKKTELEINTKFKKGSLSFFDSNFKLENIFGGFNFNSTTGFNNSAVSFKLNSIPMQFDINSVEKKNKSYTQASSKADIDLSRLLSFSELKNYFKGRSSFNINLILPSFMANSGPYNSNLSIVSSLKGTEINFFRPIRKVKELEVAFNIKAVKRMDVNFPEIKFSYGKGFRGKFNAKPGALEGFLILGEKKQSISILPGQITLIGSLEEFNIANLPMPGETKNIGPKWVIRDLFIKKFNFSSAVLLDTTLDMQPIRGGYVFSLLNRDFKGSIFSGNNSEDISINLDYLKLNNFQDGEDKIFGTVYNFIKLPFNFSVDEFNFNDLSYGHWKFKVIPEKKRLILSNLEGKYGKWGLKKQDSESRSSLSIIKTMLGWQSSLSTMIYSGSPDKAFKQIGIDPLLSMKTIEIFPDVSWEGLPWEFNFKKIKGTVGLSVKNLIIDSNDNGIEAPENLLRLISIFNVTDTFKKVTSLNFSKLYKKGFSADSLDGKLLITKEGIEVNEPLIFKSGSSQFKWTGNVLIDELENYSDLNLQVVMTLPLREYLSAYALILGGPFTAGIVYIAGKAFKRNLDQISSGKWTVKGKIEDPKTNFEGWFED